MLTYYLIIVSGSLGELFILVYNVGIGDIGS
jgi:hypothetical protein